MATRASGDEVRVEVVGPDALGFGRLFVEIREAIVVADAARRRVVLSNPEAETLLGYGPGETIGLPLAEIVPGYDAWAGGAGPLELVARRKDGRELPVDLTLTAIGEGDRFVMALMRDATERRQQAVRREALLQAARRCASQATSEAVLRALIEEAVALVGGDDGGIARWVDAERRLVQVESFLPSESRGTALDLERSVSGRAATRQAAVITNDYQQEGDPNSPAGRMGVRAGLAVPLIHEGRLIGTLSVSTFDPEKRFSDDDAAALELLAGIGASALIGRERAELEGALLVRNELLSEVSHDLRTPVTAAKGNVQLLRRDVRQVEGPLGEKLARGMERLERSIERMAEMIDLLRDVAQLETGQPLELRRRPVDLVALARAEVDEYAALAPTHKLRLRAAEPEVVGAWDAARLERVLDNLIGNAVKYSPEGGTVTVAVRREPGEGGDWAVVEVRDRGVGIPAADLPHIFDRFYRAANVSRRIRGTGIGLAGARQIVEQHGGSVEVHTRVGKGSTFTVRLPVAGPEDEEGM